MNKQEGEGEQRDPVRNMTM